MLFLPKWAQTVSKFILFHTWTAIFKLNINFQFLTISEMLLPISENVENRKFGLLKNETSIWQVFLVQI